MIYYKQIWYSLVKEDGVNIRTFINSTEYIQKLKK